jgi:plasmid stabilization system protein ParE
VITARRIVKEIVDTTINLPNHPKKGTIEVLLSNKPQEFRYLIHKNYKVIYRINETENRIEISTVFDCRQNPIKILS